MHHPQHPVLDEPFSGLDPIAVDVMSKVLLDKAADGIPVVFSSHQLDLVERLCHRVGIIRSGQMVAVGAVDELRSGGAAELVVDAPDRAATGWASGLAGVTVRGQDGGRTVLELGDGADDQAVLRAALATGPVTEFSRRRPSLTELYRDVVTQRGGATKWRPHTTDVRAGLVSGRQPRRGPRDHHRLAPRRSSSPRSPRWSRCSSYGIIVIKAIGGGGTSADKVGLTPQTAPLAASLFFAHHRRRR